MTNPGSRLKTAAAAMVPHGGSLVFAASIMMVDRGAASDAVRLRASRNSIQEYRKQNAAVAVTPGRIVGSRIVLKNC